MRLPQCCQKVVAASGRRTIQLCASIGLPPTPLVTCLLGALDGRNPESLTTGRVVRCLDTQVYHSPVHPSELPRRRLLGRVTRPHLSSVSPPSLSHAHVRRQCFTLREGKDRLTILILGSCSPPLLCGLAPRPLSPHTAQHRLDPSSPVTVPRHPTGAFSGVRMRVPTLLGEPTGCGPSPCT